MADLEDMSRDELYELAQERDIEGRGSMTRDELEEALRSSEEEDGDTDDGADGDSDADEAEGGSSSEEDDDGSGGDEDDEDDDGSGGDEEDGERSGGGSARKLTDVLADAREQLRDLIGLPVEGVAEFDRRDDGWDLVLIVRELERVPRATDVLGLYEVRLDTDGDLVSFARVSRYVRSQVESVE